MLSFRWVRALRARLHQANWEFWIGNFVVVLSTVLGVYLAANAALETAMEFEALRSDRDNYHLRTSLREEFDRNLGALDGIAAVLEEHGYRYQASIAAFPKMRFFVWEAMKTAPQTLATPSHILAGVQSLYDEAQELLRRSETHRIGPAYLAEQLRELTAATRAGLLAEMDADLADLRTRLVEAQLIAPPAAAGEPASTAHAAAATLTPRE